MKKVFLKIYCNKNNMKDYYIDRIEALFDLLEYNKNNLENNILSNVYEPILMTEKEFISLPEFTGF